MRILHLIVTKQWFDMIESEEKKEEYRDITRYWRVRLCSGFPELYSAKDYDIVRFRNGYQKDARVLNVEWKGLRKGSGKPKWGAVPNKHYFVIKLGKIIRDEA